MTQLDEFGMIRHLTQRLTQSNRGVRTGIGDDAAVLIQEADTDQLITTDAMVEGVHFLPATMRWSDVGYKCVAVSVSDIAAMGGTARHVVLSVALSKNVELADLEALYDGVSDACQAYDCSVVGGDVVRSEGPFVITSTVLGVVPAGQALLRSGAQPGDVVYVTGPLGGSMAGLTYLLEKPMTLPEEAMQLMTFHRRPTAQVAAGGILREERASSCNDVSDGLASELNEIAKSSGVRIRVQTIRVPITPSVRNFTRQRGESALDYAWYGGEDYQLVGTAAPYAYARALSRCASVGIPLTQIGRVEVGDGVIAESGDGQVEQILPRGYNHFT